MFDVGLGELDEWIPSDFLSTAGCDLDMLMDHWMVGLNERPEKHCEVATWEAWWHLAVEEVPVHDPLAQRALEFSDRAQSLACAPADPLVGLPEIFGSIGEGGYGHRAVDTGTQR